MKKNKGDSIKENSSEKYLSPRQQIERRINLRRKAKKDARKKRVRLTLGVIAIISLVVIISAPAAIINSFLKSINSDELIGGIEPLANQPVNILILGMDIGDVSQTENSNIKRTDTIMVLNYNPNTDKITLVSIPRDTLIEVDAYDGTGTLRHYWKINNAYVLGGEEEVIEHVEKLLETKINYLVKIDYSAFRNFIDALGGVEMYIEQDMYYDDPQQDLSINFKGGETVLLDGQAAEEFVRWRKNNDGTGLVNGDLGRIENQQKFISEVIKKSLTLETMMNISEILDVISADIKTNMPGEEILKYGFKAILNKGVSMLTLQGYDTVLYGESFLVSEKEANMEIIKTLKTGSVLDEGAERSDYKILILNGTRVTGLAGELKTSLEDIGYYNIGTGNSERVDESLIISENSKLRKQLSLDLGIDNFENKNKENSDYDAVIVVGEDLMIYE